ncbi:hypothetical protein C5167_028307 [Papaver somniferum]|uniref:uncharacterized protein At2g24330-like n=1 Tax=Papaver somniferum TaxID=3469 RepID=UPI000E70296C|nr:uncharacterized protein At2g24330-like [Papaver somniferum]RZC87853.1 hypothetical protein C5167_028307 [Papaver somniferum]
MAEVSDQSKDVPENLSSVDKTKETKTTKKQRKGIFSRIWNGLFGSRKDDFEKRLQNISKEEATVMARMKRRTQSWRRMARNLIVFSVLLEAVAVAYAIMTTRTLDLEWKTRAIRVLPMFLLPGLTAVIYTTLGSFSRMCERKDKKTLERLREERQAKIDELKERTNYYITQQLIQRYDPDPAAKAAAASVLASKLGADSGLKVFLGDESKVDPASGKSRDVELAQSKGLRNRQNRSNSTGTLALNQSLEEVPDNVGPTGSEPATHNQVVVDHHPNSTIQDGGWVARIAALLVGEDPTQSYALICGNCHMHNGLARKEDFSYITYYCPHCHALNKSKQLEESGASAANSSHASIPDTPNSGEATIAPTSSNLINKNLSAVVETLAGEIEEKVAEPESS